ncbi:hypothetical protein ACFX13_036292 [Malus domestica]
MSISLKSFIYKSSSFESFIYRATTSKASFTKALASKASFTELQFQSFSAGYTNTASEQPPLRPIYGFNLKSSANRLY